MIGMSDIVGQVPALVKRPPPIANDTHETKEPDAKKIVCERVGATAHSEAKSQLYSETPTGALEPKAELEAHDEGETHARIGEDTPQHAGSSSNPQRSHEQPAARVRKRIRHKLTQRTQKQTRGVQTEPLTCPGCSAMLNEVGQVRESGEAATSTPVTPTTLTTPTLPKHKQVSEVRTIQPKTLSDRGAAQIQVSSLDDLFSWPTHAFEVVTASFGTNALLTLARKMRGTTLSTAFSGVDAPGSAACMITHALRQHVSSACPVKEIPHVHATEWQHESQLELLNHPNPPMCLYDDIETFYSPEVRKAIEDLKCRQKATISLEDMRPLIFSGKAVQLHSHCLKCRKMCRIRSSSIHVAGPPCIDYAPMGLCGREAGVATTVFVAWCCLRKKMQEPIIVHENSSRFNASVLHDIFDDDYIILSSLIDPVIFGWPSRRNRRWTILLHRLCVVETYASLDNVLPLFQRLCMCSWGVYMVAEATQLEEELEWLQSWPKSRAREASVRKRFNDEGAFRDALTSFELQNLEQYETEPGWQERVHMLQQNPHVGRGISSGADILNTVIKNSGVMFSSPHQRSLHWSELLISQGFPVLPGLAYPSNPQAGASCCSFAIARQKSQPRRRSAVAGQAGNSMNLNVVGVMLLYALMWVRRADQALEEELGFTL